MSTFAGYARSGAWSIVSQGIQLLGAVASSIIVVRSLSDEAFGQLGLARRLTALVVILSGLAMERAALRFIPEILERAGPHHVVAFFWRTLAVRVVVWVPLMGLVLVMAPRLNVLFQTEWSTYAVVGALTAIVFSLFNHVRGCATARFATQSVALGSAVASILTLVVTIVLLEAGYGVVGVLAGAAAGILAGSLVMLPAAVSRQLDPTFEPASNPQFESPVARKRVVRYAMPFAAIAVLNFVVHSQTEVFFLSYFHGVEVAGFFDLGFIFAQRLIDFVPIALWEVSMAGFSHIAVRDAERLPDALRAYLTLLYLAIMPLACLGIAFSPAAISFLYTEAKLPAAIVSQAYFAMAVVAAFGAPVGMIVYARERMGAALRAYVLFSVVNVGLDLALIPKWGVPGALASLGLAKALAVLLMVRIAWNEIPNLQVPWAFMGRALVASTPVLLWLIVDDTWNSPWQLGLGLTAGILTLVLSFRVCRVIGPRERDLIDGTRLPLRHVLLYVLSDSPWRRS